MKRTESHPIRNGIVATVLGGILLSFWPPFRDVLAASAFWVWETIKSFGIWLTSTQDIYGWALIILVLLALPAIFELISLAIRKKNPGVEDLYRSDHLFGADWDWSYKNGDIQNLWCLCPTCKSELVYSEFTPDPYNFDHNQKEPRTDFFCERCNMTQCTITGDRRYALGKIKREIRRKIRSGEWRPESPANNNRHSVR